MKERKGMYAHVQHWLESQQGYRILGKLSPIDFVAEHPRKGLFLLECKGDQKKKDSNAARNNFLMAFGQVALCMGYDHAKQVRYGVVFTGQYRKLIERFLSALHPKIEVFVLAGSKVRKIARPGRPALKEALKAAPSNGHGSERAKPTKGQGHPDGERGLRNVRYRVLNGRIAWVSRSGTFVPVRTFAALCRMLGIDFGGDSAARALWRAVTRRGGGA